MGLTLSMLLSLFIHLMHPAHTAVTTQAQVTDEVEPSVTPTVTVMPTDAPSVTPTDTITPTDTPIPTVGQATPTPSVTPKEDGDSDDMLGVKADVHALFGLMNAAFHHERNEDRFEQKHK